MTEPPAGARPGLLLLVMENQQAINVLGNQNAPNITRLAQTYPVATRYFGTTHRRCPTTWSCGRAAPSG